MSKSEFRGDRDAGRKAVVNSQENMGKHALVKSVGQPIGLKIQPEEKLMQPLRSGHRTIDD